MIYYYKFVISKNIYSINLSIILFFIERITITPYSSGISANKIVKTY